MIAEKQLSQKLGINLKHERLKGIFVQGVHFFKYSERKIVYCEDAVYRLIQERDNGEYLHKKQRDMGQLISEWAKS